MHDDNDMAAAEAALERNEAEAAVTCAIRMRNMSGSHQQIQVPVNLTAIAGDYLSARNGMRLSTPKSHAAIISLARRNSLADVLNHGLGLHVQANFGSVVSLVKVLDDFEFPDDQYRFTMEWFHETADTLIDQYIEWAQAAVVSMGNAIDAVEDAFAAFGTDE